MNTRLVLLLLLLLLLRARVDLKCNFSPSPAAARIVARTRRRRCGRHRGGLRLQPGVLHRAAVFEREESAVLQVKC